MAARSLRLVALTVSAFAMPVLGSGCAEDGVSMHIICSIQPAVEEGTCTFDPAGTSCISDGWMNLSATDLYRVSLRIESGLIARQRAVPPQGEPNGILLRSAEVELRLPSGEKIGFNPDESGAVPPNPFTVVGTGYVAPGDLGQMSLSIVTPAHARQLLDPETGQLFAPLIVASIKVHGLTSGDTKVSSGEYLWPIYLTSTDLRPEANQCRVMDYCDALIGQDFFASACRRPGGD